MRFDHLMHWVPDLEAGIARCTELGFAPQRLGRKSASICTTAAGGAATWSISS
jgi:hypothetical protein